MHLYLCVWGCLVVLVVVASWCILVDCALGLVEVLLGLLTYCCMTCPAHSHGVLQVSDTVKFRKLIHSVCCWRFLNVMSFPTFSPVPLSDWYVFGRM